jgi:hypothetical protein
MEQYAPVGSNRNPPAVQAGDAPANGSPALQLSPKQLVLGPIPLGSANRLVRERHYLHSAPSGLRLSLGVFARGELVGVLQFNAGPRGARNLFEGASPAEVLSLCRLWLDDELRKNSESRVLAVACRLLAKHTPAKAVRGLLRRPWRRPCGPHLPRCRLALSRRK